jgi:hypothetical protein
MIDSTGLGPYDGPGASSASNFSLGASYGGSGGRPICAEAFANTGQVCFVALGISHLYLFLKYKCGVLCMSTTQIGSVDVMQNAYFPIATNPTFGSGAGLSSSGVGGGRIILMSSASIFLNDTGALLAEGSASAEPLLGSGSGGSVSLIAPSLSGTGLVSVAGGNTLSRFAGAGGGGRITVLLSSAYSASIEFVATGGVYAGGNVTGYSSCLAGSAGTVFFATASATVVTSATEGSATTATFAALAETDEARTTVVLPAVFEVTDRVYNMREASSNSVYYGSLVVDGGDFSGYALTVLQYLPSNMIAVTVTDKAYVGLTDSISLLSLSTCDEVTNDGCSALTVNSASLLLMPGSDEITISAQFIDVESHATVLVSSSVLSNLTVNLTAVNIVVDNSSSISYSSSLIVHTTRDVKVENSILFSGVDGGAPNVLIRSEGNITMAKLFTVNALLSAKWVKMLSDGYIGSPSNLFETGCWRNVSTADFTCNERNEYNGTIFSNNTVVVTGRRGVSVASGAIVEGSAVLICSSSIDVESNATISAVGRGCPQGRGAGSGDFDLRVGGGGGYGGVGGAASDGAVTVPGGQAYYGGGKLFSGSSGGCSNSDLSSYGGGIVALHANFSVFMNGTLKATGGAANSTNGCGGGSGGVIAVRSFNLNGYGSIVSNGGQGGSDALGFGGGGGGGGVVLVYNYNPNDLNTFKDFLGTISVVGGAAGSSQSQSGGYGELPLCPLGYGTTQGGGGVGTSSGPLCTECVTSFYKDAINSGPCQVCNNGLGAFQYVKCGTNPAFGNWETDLCPGTPECPYVCTGNAAREQCLNPIVLFLFLAGEWACTNSQRDSKNIGCAWGGCFVDFFFGIVLFMAPIYYYRYKRRRDYDKQLELKILAFSKAQKTKKKKDSSADAIEMSETGTVISNPLQLTRRRDELVDDRVLGSNIGFGQSAGKGFLDLKNSATDSKELRLAMRLADSDMHAHACRVYLLGSNHPDKRQGEPGLRL